MHKLPHKDYKKAPWQLLEALLIPCRCFGGKNNQHVVKLQFGRLEYAAHFFLFFTEQKRQQKKFNLLSAEVGYFFYRSSRLCLSLPPSWCKHGDVCAALSESVKLTLTRFTLLLHRWPVYVIQRGGGGLIDFFFLTKSIFINSFATLLHR